ncbi:MAG TPA: hypothetical protein VF331_01870, partial [Polyangiales bacterium]
GLPASIGHLSLYVGLGADSRALALPKHNIWVYPSADHDGNYARAVRDPDAPIAGAFLSFASARDPDFERRHPGHATAEVVTFGSADAFAAWRDTQWNKRGDDYEAYKKTLSDRLLEVLFAQLPQLRGRVLHAELSTPLSTQHFTGHPNGAIYGLGHGPARFDARWLRPQTEIPGLWLTGADVCSCGVTGALMGGVLCASAMLGRNLISVAMRGAQSVH